MSTYPFHLRRPLYGEPAYSHPFYSAPTLGLSATWSPGGGVSPVPPSGSGSIPTGARSGLDRAHTGRLRGAHPRYPNG